MRHRWPGNVRELKNAMERAVMNIDGDEVQVESLEIGASTPPVASVRSVAAAAIAAGAFDAPSRLSVACRAAAEHAERVWIVDVLNFVGGSRSRAVQALGVSRARRFPKKLKRYEIG